MTDKQIPPQLIYAWVDRMSAVDRGKLNSRDYTPVQAFFSLQNGYAPGYTPTDDEVLEVRTVALDYLGLLTMR